MTKSESGIDKYHDKSGVKKDPTRPFLELLNDQDN